MLICNQCGRIMREEELGAHNDWHGEFCETVQDDCECGGEFIEATQCKVCGEWFDNSDLHGVCEACLEKYETVGTALEIGAINTQKVDGINGFVASVLPVEQINHILEKWVEENFVDHSKPVVNYIEDDKSYFSEYLEDKYGE